MDCADIGEAQVVKSFLEAQGFHPRVRDEQTRSVAPHFGQLLGKLTLEIPEVEYMEASLAMEKQEPRRVQAVSSVSAVSEIEQTQKMAKLAMWNAILGCLLIPIICNFYSMRLGYRVLKTEVPLSRVSRNRLLWAILFNSIAFYVWLAIGPKFFIGKTL